MQSYQDPILRVLIIKILFYRIRMLQEIHCTVEILFYPIRILKEILLGSCTILTDLIKDTVRILFYPIRIL